MDKLIRNSTAEFLIFTSQNKEDSIEVKVFEESVWLTQNMIAQLFEKSKLEFCEENGITISETHYLLGLIYNDDLHWHEQRDYETPLISKLENMTIKKMIQEIFS